MVWADKFQNLFRILHIGNNYSLPLSVKPRIRLYHIKVCGSKIVNFA